MKIQDRRTNGLASRLSIPWQEIAYACEFQASHHTKSSRMIVFIMRAWVGYSNILLCCTEREGRSAEGSYRFPRQTNGGETGGSETPSMSNRKHRDNQEICARRVRELAQAAVNKHCFECGQPGVTYINITVGCFVCTSCSGMLWVWQSSAEKIFPSRIFRYIIIIFYLAIIPPCFVIELVVLAMLWWHKLSGYQMLCICSNRTETDVYTMHIPYN